MGNFIREAKSIKHFKSMLMQFFTLKNRSLFSIHDQIDAKLLTRLRLKFNRLSKLKIRHKFKNCIRLMWNFDIKIETTEHFFLALPNPCQWKTESPWRLLSDTSSRYMFWWRISIKWSAIWFRWINHKRNREMLLRIIPNLVLICAGPKAPKAC